MKLPHQQVALRTLMNPLLIATLLVTVASHAQVTVPPITLPQVTLPTGGKLPVGTPTPAPVPAAAPVPKIVLPGNINPGSLTAGTKAASMPKLATSSLPVTLNYQGFLTDAKSGVPLNTAQSVTFKFFDASSGGTQLYTETQSLTPVNGVLSAQIGSVTAFPATLLFDKPYWLEVTVGSDTLAPRQPIAAVAFAQNAVRLASRAGGNTGVGDGTLLHTSGPDNTAVGTNALTANTTGNANTAMGSAALGSNTTGSNNAATGYYALGSNTTANSNSAFGAAALNLNTTGNDNTAIGYSAMGGNKTGVGNVAVGKDALGLSDNGSNNVAIGVGALMQLQSAQVDFADAVNIAIGYGSGGALRHGQRNIYIGNPGVDSETGTIRIGNGEYQTHNRVFIAGVTDTNLGGTLYQPVLIDNFGQLGTAPSVSSTSDRNVKENFADVDPSEVLAKVAQLPLQTWNYRSDDHKARHLGPMAQDFHAAFNIGQDDKHIMMVDADGVALAAIQGLYRLVQDKETELAQLKSDRNALLARVEALESSNREQMALLMQTIDRLLAQDNKVTQVVRLH